jgi:hypothetical protein
MNASDTPMLTRSLAIRYNANVYKNGGQDGGLKMKLIKILNNRGGRIPAPPACFDSITITPAPATHLIPPLGRFFTLANTETPRGRADVLEGSRITICWKI